MIIISKSACNAEKKRERERERERGEFNLISQHKRNRLNSAPVDDEGRINPSHVTFVSGARIYLAVCVTLINNRLRRVVNSQLLFVNQQQFISGRTVEIRPIPTRTRRRQWR